MPISIGEVRDRATSSHDPQDPANSPSVALAILARDDVWMANSGGITASRAIASYAELTQTPIGFHSGTCSLVQFYASLHLTAATPNIFKVENMLGQSRGFKENMATVKLAVRNAMLRVPEGPGLGLELNVDWVKSHLQPGEVWWG